MAALADGVSMTPIKDIETFSDKKMVRKMKQTTIQWSLLTIIMVAILSTNLISCGDDDEEEFEQTDSALLVGQWKCTTVNTTSSQYDTYSFYNDGVGMYRKWENNTSSYCMVFSYSYSNNTLILNFGFDYIRTYRVNNLTSQSLSMYSSLLEIMGQKVNGSDRNTFPNYATDIVATWSIDDTEKSQNYVITLRSDGTYESQSTSKATITENGNYRVENSRVKFTSNNNNSLLDGRKFLITHIANKKAFPLSDGSIHLETENGVSLIGYQRIQ